MSIHPVEIEIKIQPNIKEQIPIRDKERSLKSDRYTVITIILIEIMI